MRKMLKKTLNDSPPFMDDQITPYTICIVLEVVVKIVQNRQVKKIVSSILVFTIIMTPRAALPTRARSK